MGGPRPSRAPLLQSHPSPLRLPYQQLPQQRRQPEITASARTSPNGLRKEESGASRPLRQNRHGAGAKGCPPSTTSKAPLCWENRSSRPPLRLRQLRQRRQPRSPPRLHHPALLAPRLPNGLPREESGASRPSLRNRRGVDAKGCPPLMMLRLPLCSESQPLRLQPQPFQLQPLHLPPHGRRPPKRRRLRQPLPSPALVNPQAMWGHPRSEPPEPQLREAWPRSVRKIAKLTSSAADWCGARWQLF